MICPLWSEGQREAVLCSMSVFGLFNAESKQQVTEILKVRDFSDGLLSLDFSLLYRQFKHEELVAIRYPHLSSYSFAPSCFRVIS